MLFNFVETAFLGAKLSICGLVDYENIGIFRAEITVVDTLSVVVIIISKAARLIAIKHFYVLVKKLVLLTRIETELHLTIIQSGVLTNIAVYHKRNKLVRN